MNAHPTEKTSELRLIPVVLLPFLIAVLGLVAWIVFRTPPNVATPHDDAAHATVPTEVLGGERLNGRALPQAHLYGSREALGRARQALFGPLLEASITQTFSLLPDGIEENFRPWLALVPTDILSEMAETASRANLPVTKLLVLELFDHPRGAAVFCAASRAEGASSLVAVHLTDIASTSGNHLPFAALIRPDQRHAFVSLGRPERTGVVAGMNDSGLVAVLLDGPIETDDAGRPMTLVVRDVLERASVIDSALQIIESIAAAGTGTILIADSADRAVAVEITPRLKSTRQPQGHLLLASNAFVAETSPSPAADTAYRTLDTRFRGAPDHLDAKTLDTLLAGAVPDSSDAPRLVFEPLQRKIHVFLPGGSSASARQVELDLSKDFKEIRLKR